MEALGNIEDLEENASGERGRDSISIQARLEPSAAPFPKWRHVLTGKERRGEEHHTGGALQLHQLTFRVQLLRIAPVPFRAFRN